MKRKKLILMIIVMLLYLISAPIIYKIAYEYGYNKTIVNYLKEADNNTK